eukprot:34290_1
MVPSCNWLLLMLLFSVSALTEPDFSTSTFDGTSVDDFNGDSLQIGWIQYGWCVEGTNGLNDQTWNSHLRFTNVYTQDELPNQSLVEFNTTLALTEMHVKAIHFINNTR